jgi:hypothetical protein
MTDGGKTVRPDEKTIELTLTIRGHYDVPMLERDWDPDHAYGPVERVRIERDMHSATRGYDILDVDAAVVDDADVGPLLQRARELLVEARDQVDADRESLADDQLWQYIQGAAARAESAQVLVDGAEVLEDTDAE